MRHMMLFTLLLFAFAALPSASQAQGQGQGQGQGRPMSLNVAPTLIEPQYTICKTDDECVVVTPPCGAPMTFNKKSQMMMQGYFNGTADRFKCADWIKVPRVKRTYCAKERCAIELTEPMTPSQTKFDTDPQYCEKDSDCETVVGDCCEASFLNHQHAYNKRADLEYRKDAPKSCFMIDKRKVLNLRCEKNVCTADQEPPLELNYDLRDLGNCSKWK